LPRAPLFFWFSTRIEKNGGRNGSIRPTAVSSESGNHRGEFALTDCRRASRELSRWRDIGMSKDSIPAVSRAARLAGYSESVCEEKATATTTCAQTYR
jgi:hypothetical protein